MIASDWVIVLLTGALVVVTGYYAWTTRGIARSTQVSAEATRRSADASQSMVAEIQRQHQLSQIPLFAIRVHQGSWTGGAVLSDCRIHLSNTSDAIALDVTLDVSSNPASLVAFEHPGAHPKPAERRSIMPPGDELQITVSGREVPANYRHGSAARRSTEGMPVQDGIVKTDEFQAGISVYVSYGNVLGARFGQKASYELRDRIIQ